MPEIAKIGLLDLLYKLRRDRRRIFASVITTYTANLPFYETVVLRHLTAAGSRFNVVLVEAKELAKAFSADSSRPTRAGVDYQLLPVSKGAAFHPKIMALFSDDGLAIAVGSHNLTEAGFGYNGEISVACGFDGGRAPLHISTTVANYLIECAGDLVPGDQALSRRLAERLRSRANRGPDENHELSFFGVRPEQSLLDLVFKDGELASCGRILVVGPYFDDELR